jgi:hypothetical protein
VRPAAAFLLAVFVAAPAAAEVTVRVLPASPGAAAQVELTARAAPLSEVLDRLSRQIGMKVVYEGASPRQLVTVTLHGRTPAETVLGLLEGTGVNFALQADASGARVETLLVAGSAPQTASASGAAPAPPSGRSVSPGFRRPITPPASGPDVIEEDDPEDLEEDLAEPAAPEEVAPQPDPNAGNQPAGTMPPPPGNMPTPSFPVSPFAPQPYTPQPFPPVPPGAPVGAGSPQPQQPPQESGQQPPPD